MALRIFHARSTATSSVSDSGPTGMPAMRATFSIMAGGTPFGQHQVALAQIGADHPRRIEAAGIVDHDRGLADGTHIIERGGERGIAGRLARG